MSQNKTFTAKPHEVERDWVIVDAKDQVLGRMATRIAEVLRGKNKPEYTPNIDTGDFVVVINAKDVRVTGKKETGKLYRKHSGYIGHLKTLNFRQLMDKSPRTVVEHAVWGMLPHNRLGRRQIRKLYVYDGPEHPHVAQQPKQLELEAAK